MHYVAPVTTGGGRGRPGLDGVADVVLEQPRVLYRFWPDAFNTEVWL
jgi:hypothetical protein